MKSQLSFQFDSLEELHDFTAKMAVPVAAVIQRRIADLAVAAVEESRAPKTRKTTKVAGPDTGGVPASELVEAPVVDAAQVTEADVRAAITAVNDKFGLVPARKVLAQFGAKRIPDIKPEQYANFVKACNTVK